MVNDSRARALTLTKNMVNGFSISLTLMALRLTSHEIPLTLFSGMVNRFRDSVNLNESGSGVNHPVYRNGTCHDCLKS